MIVALTARDGEPGATGEVLAALRNEPRAVIVAPDSLSDDAVATLVRSALGDQADPAFCSACAQASAGNPFLLRELVSVLKAERVEPVAANAARVQGVRPEAVSHAVVARLARLGGDASAARAVGGGARERLAKAGAALADIDHERARVAADHLISAQILAATGPLSFVHPLLRRAVYEGILPATPCRQPSPGGPAARGRGTRGARSRACTCCAASRPTTPRWCTHCATPRARHWPTGRRRRRSACCGARSRSRLRPSSAGGARRARRGRGAGTRPGRGPAPARGTRAQRRSGHARPRRRTARFAARVGRAAARGARAACPHDRRAHARRARGAAGDARDHADRDRVGRPAARRGGRPAVVGAARARGRSGTGRQCAADLRGVLARSVRAVFGRLAGAASTADSTAVGSSPSRRPVRRSSATRPRCWCSPTRSSEPRS